MRSLSRRKAGSGVETPFSGAARAIWGRASTSARTARSPSLRQGRRRPGGAGGADAGRGGGASRPGRPVQLIMADTGLVPDDGMTAGSGTTPRTVPAVRRGAAAARELLRRHRRQALGRRRQGRECQGRQGARTPARTRSLTYGDLARPKAQPRRLAQARLQRRHADGGQGMEGARRSPRLRPNRRDLVTGKHALPVGHPAARHALRQDPAPAGVRREAAVDRPGRRQGDAGRGRRPGRRFRRRSPRPHALAQAGALDAIAKTAQVGKAAAAAVSHENLYDHLSARTPAAACRQTRSPTRCPTAPRSLKQHLPRRLRPARPDGAARGRRRVGGRQADRLDRHPEPVRRARRAGPAPSAARRPTSA